jgi:hypothetical protein
MAAFLSLGDKKLLQIATLLLVLFDYVYSTNHLHYQFSNLISILESS